MSEAIRLNEEQKKQWVKVRDEVINTLTGDMPSVNESWQKAAIAKGIARLIDEKFNLAEKKATAIDKGKDYVVTIAKTATTNSKDVLIAEILEKDPSGIFTKDMLRKLSVADLEALRDRL